MSNTANRLIVFAEKHGRRFFLVDTAEKLSAVALKILRGRYREGWFEEPEVPTKPAEMLLTVEQLALLSNDARKRAEGTKREYERELGVFTRETDAHRRLRRAIDSGDGELAVRVLAGRKEYEYEGWDFEYLESV